MIDRELMDAISQLLDVKLTNELGPIKYEIKSIKQFQATAILSSTLAATSSQRISTSQSCLEKVRLIRSQAERQRADREALQEIMMY